MRQAKLAYLPRAQEQGKLTPELVARTVIYEAACQALENDNRRDDRTPGAGPELNDEKVEELVRSIAGKMTKEQIEDLAANPGKARQLAAGLTGTQATGKFIKTTVVNGFYTKNVRGTDKKAHVSVKVPQASRKWVEVLATL